MKEKVGAISAAIAGVLLILLSLYDSSNRSAKAQPPPSPVVQEQAPRLNIDVAPEASIVPDDPLVKLPERTFSIEQFSAPVELTPSPPAAKSEAAAETTTTSKKAVEGGEEKSEGEKSDTSPLGAAVAAVEAVVETAVEALSGAKDKKGDEAGGPALNPIIFIGHICSGAEFATRNMKSMLGVAGYKIYEGGKGTDELLAAEPCAPPTAAEAPEPCSPFLKAKPAKDDSGKDIGGDLVEATRLLLEDAKNKGRTLVIHARPRHLMFKGLSSLLNSFNATAVYVYRKTFVDTIICQTQDAAFLRKVG